MNKTIATRFEQVVKKHRDDIAIVENDRCLTFGELSNMVNVITGTFPEKISTVGIVMKPDITKLPVVMKEGLCA